MKRISQVIPISILWFTKKLQGNISLIFFPSEIPTNSRFTDYGFPAPALAAVLAIWKNGVGYLLKVARIYFYPAFCLACSVNCGHTYKISLISSATIPPQCWNVLALMLPCLQRGWRVARVTQSQASRTPRYDGTSSSSLAGCASTPMAAAACPSNFTTSGGSGCRNPTKRATR